MIQTCSLRTGPHDRPQRIGDARWCSSHEGCRGLYDEPHIEFLHEGDAADEFNGGPITEAGYYVMPFCHPMCCRRAVACEWSRARAGDLF